MTLYVAYDDRLLKWRLGKNHPTNPVRAKNAVHMLGQLGVPMRVERISEPDTSLLESVHSPRYVAQTLDGWNDEWQGKRLDLGKTAALMFQGTVDCVNAIEAGAEVAFSPQGAKHHAQWAQGSGFCVFNDMAWAAQSWAWTGERVLYVDLDAHHGDGVENLTYGITDVMTASIHDGTIFPGTGHWDAPALRVYNWPLEAGSGDAQLIAAVEEALMIATRFDPTVILVAVGGDGHALDPLSSLQYSYDGYREAGTLIGEFAAFQGAGVLIGGAGGYRPKDATPTSWASFVASLYTARTM